LFSRLLMPKTCFPPAAEKFHPVSEWSPAVSARGASSSSVPWKSSVRTPVFAVK